VHLEHADACVATLSDQCLHIYIVVTTLGVKFLRMNGVLVVSLAKRKGFVIGLALLSLGWSLWLPRLASSALVNRGALLCKDTYLASGGIDCILSAPVDSRTRISVCEAAYGDFAIAARYDPSNDRALLWLAYVELVRGNYEAAQAYLLTGAKASSNNQFYPFLLGMTSYALGKPDQAMAYWAQLDNAEKALLSVGDRLQWQGEDRQAVKYYRVAVSMYAGSSDAHLKLAEALYTLGESDEALLYYGLGFDKLGRSNSASVNVGEASYHQALILIGHDRYAEAILALERANIWHPGYPIYTSALGKVYGLLGDYEKAEYWLNETVRISPASGSAYWEYGNYYMQRQMFKQAVLKFEQAVAVEPQGPAYLYGNLGLAYLILGDTDRAIQALREALRRDPGNSTYEGWLAAALSTKIPNE